MREQTSGYKWGRGATQGLQAGRHKPMLKDRLKDILYNGN